MVKRVKWKPGDLPPADLARVARRVVWFRPPRQALADPVHFLCYLMTYTTMEDLAVACRYFSRADFEHAFDNRLKGVIDRRSEGYWALMLGRKPKRRRDRHALPWPGR
jgi:hypothetical protein